MNPSQISLVVRRLVALGVPKETWNKSMKHNESIFSHVEMILLPIIPSLAVSSKGLSYGGGPLWVLSHGAAEVSLRMGFD